VTSKLGAAHLFAQVAQDLSAQPDLDQTLEQVVHLAVACVPGCDFAGVSWLHRDNRIETPACSDPVVAQCDEAQYQFGEGPCVEAAWEDEADHYVVDDLETDPRWPKFAARAVELGMRSMLACRLSSPQRSIGALNLYAAEPHSFDRESQQLATVFAAHASVALAHQRLQADLRGAYESRGIIGQAIGILIERHRLTSDEAFKMLMRASQSQHVKLRELARFVVETGMEPDAVRADDEGRIVAG
jgi:GAF domain-containing protein